MAGLEGCRKAFGRSVALNQHQFDSLDHPVALTEPDTICVMTEPAYPSDQSAL
ncbi:MAG TPA: hypothetical protein VE222_09500 [Nitrospiraceae bacterium]|nr:hypothetical protein [Nitrospiraceae bacterium]